MKTLAPHVRSFLVIAILTTLPAAAGAQDASVLHKVTSGWTVDVSRGQGPDAATLQLVATGPNNQQRTAWLDSRSDEQLLDVRVWNDQVLIVLGVGTFSTVNVVPIATGSQTDFFRTLGASVVSPDSRFIVYRKFYGRAKEEAEVYLAYDVAASPAANRMNSGPVDDPLGSWVGWAFYPTERRVTHTYVRPDDEGSPNHNPSSPFVWVDNQRLVFVQTAEDVASAIMVDFAQGTSSPVVTEQVLDVNAIVDPSAVHPGEHAASFIHVDSISVALTSTGVDVTLHLHQPPAPSIVIESVVVHF